jgi:hypothetical protein
MSPKNQVWSISTRSSFKKCKRRSITKLGKFKIETKSILLLNKLQIEMTKFWRTKWTRSNNLRSSCKVEVQPLRQAQRETKLRLYLKNTTSNRWELKRRRSSKIHLKTLTKSSWPIFILKWTKCSRRKMRMGKTLMVLSAKTKKQKLKENLRKKLVSTSHKLPNQLKIKNRPKKRKS